MPAVSDVTAKLNAFFFASVQPINKNKLKINENCNIKSSTF
jgi:hypothetical protein